MTENHPNNVAGISRRELLATSGKLAAASALAGVAIPQQVFAAQDSTIQVALVGCGGRGTGAAENALSVKNGPIKLVAMADVFEDKLAQSHKSISTKFPTQVEVPDDRKFIGFDAYKKAMDVLKPGDVVIMATPPAFRWVQFSYAIDRGLNVFMEKPISVDGPTSKKMMKLGEDAKKKNLKVGVGLMCRHCTARRELYDRIKQGEIGDITLLRAYRVAGPTGSAFVGPKPAGMSELEYQIRNFHAFLWLSGGGFSDFLIHNIDECCWMKDAWPVEAKGFGGRHYRLDNVDQNFDSYTVEYTFADGTKLMLEGRCMPGCHNEFASYAHGTKGSAVISTASHSPAYCRIYKNHQIQTKRTKGKDDPNVAWSFPQPEPNPYQIEWDELIAAIRQDQPYNEVQRGAEASLVTAMGRMACHTGQIVTYDEMLNCEHEFAPDVDKLTLASSAPLQADANGKYPVPLPGITKKREYLT
ncbi:MAG: Gfo/Idh/MocA family protein [Planctomycetaceae bacterium]